MTSASETTINIQDIKLSNTHRHLYNHVYKDAVSDFKQNYLQEGFDEGFREGIQRGNLMGKALARICLESFITKQTCIDEAEDQSKSSKVSNKERKESEENQKLLDKLMGIDESYLNVSSVNEISTINDNFDRITE